MGEPILLLFGVGKNIGAHTVSTFKEKGYRVAQAARSLKSEDSTDNILSIPCDLTKPAAVSDAFNVVREKWGEPSVVAYNAAGARFTKKEETFSVETSDFETDLTINTTSVFVALRESIASFQTFSDAKASKTFLYTGNICNEGPFPGGLTLSVGKAASAYLIQTADAVHKEEGMQFFYVDERKPEGQAMYGGIGGQAHADFFSALAERKAGAVPWQATFVKDKGYVEFPHGIIS